MKTARVTSSQEGPFGPVETPVTETQPHPFLGETEGITSHRNSCFGQARSVTERLPEILGQNPSNPQFHGEKPAKNHWLEPLPFLEGKGNLEKLPPAHCAELTQMGARDFLLPEFRFGA